MYIMLYYSHQRCSLRKSVLRNFAKFKGKHLKVSDTGIFLWNLRNFKEHHFYKTSLGYCFLCYSRCIALHLQPLHLVRLTDRSSTFSKKKDESFYWPPVFECDRQKRMRNTESAVWKYTVENVVYGIWKEYRNGNICLLIPK